MNPTMLAASLLLFGACDGDHDHAHDQAPGQEQAHDHGEAAPPPAPAPPAPPPAAAAGSVHEAPLGAHTARLEVVPEGLKLTVTDGSGALVAATGEARIVLTGTGEAEQRVILSPSADGWRGPARASTAPGYVAVLSLELAGHTETARLSWGEVPAPAPAAAPAPHTHPEGEGDDRGHGHGH